MAVLHRDGIQAADAAIRTIDIELTLINAV